LRTWQKKAHRKARILQPASPQTISFPRGINPRSNDQVIHPPEPAHLPTLVEQPHPSSVPARTATDLHAQSLLSTPLPLLQTPTRSLQLLVPFLPPQSARRPQYSHGGPTCWAQRRRAWARRRSTARRPSTSTRLSARPAKRKSALPSWATIPMPKQPKTQPHPPPRRPLLLQRAPSSAPRRSAQAATPPLQRPASAAAARSSGWAWASADLGSARSAHRRRRLRRRSLASGPCHGRHQLKVRFYSISRRFAESAPPHTLWRHQKRKTLTWNLRRRLGAVRARQVRHAEGHLERRVLRARRLRPGGAGRGQVPPRRILRRHLHLLQRVLWPARGRRARRRRLRRPRDCCKGLYSQIWHYCWR